MVYLSVNSAPAVKYPNCVIRILLYILCLVCYCVWNSLNLAPITAVCFDNVFHHCKLNRWVPSEICFAYKTLRSVHTLAFFRHNARCIVLKKSGNSRNLHRSVRRKGWSDSILSVNGKLCLTCRASLSSTVFRRLNNLYIKTCIFVISLL